MSLTSELAGGPLAAWFRDHFPGDDVATAVARDLESRPRRGPARGTVPAGHWPAVGAAVGTRLAWAAQPAPPYYAILGAQRAGLIGWDAANAAAAAFPSHRPGPDGPPAGATVSELLAWRPTPAGWVDTAPPPPQRPAYRQDGTASDLVAAFLGRAGRFLDRVPAGALGTTGEETVLARVGLVLAAWEDAYRRGPQLAPGARAAIATAIAAGDAGSLLDTVNPDALADSAAVIAHARQNGLIAQLAASGGTTAPAGYAFPVFVEQWADGDLLLDPGTGTPTTLIDVKTVMGARGPSTVLRWLHQLLGYALLVDCYAPEWRLGRIGLCFARHAHVVSWDVDELAAALAEGRLGALGAARRDFDRVFRETLAARGLLASET